MNVSELSMETLLLDTKDHILTITLNRPKNLNAFNDQMISEFQQLWQLVRFEDDIHVVILRAAPGRRVESAGSRSSYGSEIERSVEACCLRDPWDVRWRCFLLGK
jgi:1,4-dihydroxy-2-naphthoyl-CoA synthase